MVAVPSICWYMAVGSNGHLLCDLTLGVIPEAEVCRVKAQGDDVFAILDSKDIQPFFSHIDSIEPAIRFSMELEKDSKLPFLDVCVKRKGDTLSTSVYKKPTHTDRLLDFDSYHPDCQKMYVFRNNGYPNKTIRKWTKARLTDTPEQRPHITSRVTIPYIKGASEVTAIVLRDNGVQVAHKPLNTLHRNLTKVKYTTSRCSLPYRLHGL
ncbi:uncharacterized protein LOC143017574 [Oratosquilla oratoria]|uniref:uncharacterized protein LOC143017574 n=1 Tax=Oratosquilla oratoria TaxID=337810 RepID=UPI003F75AC3A